MNITQERINHIGDRFYTMFYDETPATKEAGLKLVESMYQSFVTLNPELDAESCLEVYRQVFRPLQNEVFKAFHEGGE